MKILAIDPGLTIGYCYIDVNSKTGTINMLGVDEERVEDYKPFTSHPMNLIRASVLDYLVVEDFVGAGPRTKEATGTLKMIGAFEMLAHERGIPFKLQTNIMRKPCLKEGVTIFRALNEGRYPCHHGKDALAHALRFLRDKDEKWKQPGWWS